MHSRALLLGITAGIALSSTGAHAATKKVAMGVPSEKIAKQFFALNGEPQAFFPETVTINAGDRVEFHALGFHNLDLPPTGGAPLPLLGPTGAKSEDKDAAGADFWFKGLDVLGFNALLMKMRWGKTFTYAGQRINSGLPLGDDLEPVTVKFPKTGTFTYFCNIHAGMKGKVRVVGKGQRVPSAKADKRAVANQLDAAMAELRAVNKTKVGSGVIQIGGAGKGGVESFNFFPAKSSVRVGTTVTFQMPPGSVEVHTATTGPGDPDKQPRSYLGTLASSFQSEAFDPRATYGSEAPGSTPAQLTKSLHGNGFWNTGVLDRSDSTPPPAESKVTFAEAGTFDFYCLIHPFMKTTVTATA